MENANRVQLSFIARGLFVVISAVYKLSYWFLCPKLFCTNTRYIMIISWKKGRCRDFTCNSKADKISLSHESNKKAKQKKSRWAIKSGNGHKIPRRPKRRRRLWWEGFVEKVSFESGVEQRWSDA